MKVTLISTSDRSGGAAIACMRLASAMAGHGHEVRVLVMEKKGGDPLAVPASPARTKLDGLLRHAQYAFEARTVFHSERPFSGDPWWGHDISNHPDVRNADILQLHWINQGFLGMDDLAKLFALGKPVFWHLHDLWAFTGGCHYPGTCTRFEIRCGDCPSLRSPGPRDTSHTQWERKAAMYAYNPPVLVGASAWLAGEAKRSSLAQGAKVTHIPNPIDPEAYFPASSRKDARQKMRLPAEKRYLLFAAMNAADSRKGFNELCDALRLAASHLPDTELLVAGKARADLQDALPLPARLLGSLGPEGMRTAYQAADAFVIPSLEENLPNTVLESLACGTPVAGFRTGGIPEMVEDGRNGFLADTGDAQGLARAIRSIWEHPEPGTLASGALAKVREGFLPSQVADAYTNLFREILDARSDQAPRPR